MAAKILPLHRGKAVEALLEQHPEARELADTLAHMEQQLGKEAMGLILEFFQAEANADGPADPALLDVVARIEAFERSRGR